MHVYEEDEKKEKQVKPRYHMYTEKVVLQKVSEVQ